MKDITKKRRNTHVFLCPAVMLIVGLHVKLYLKRLIHTSHLVSAASNRGVTIDVVTREEVSCRLRIERVSYFFKPRL